MKKILLALVLVISIAVLGCKPESVSTETPDSLQPERTPDLQPTPPQPAQTAESTNLLEEDILIDEADKMEIECNMGMRCLDAHRIGFQTGKCAFLSVKTCIGGCENDICSERLPPVETQNRDHPVIEEGLISYDRAGWQFVDFGKEISTTKRIIFDVKIKQYSEELVRNYFRSESIRYALWTVARPIETVTYLDCYNERDKRTQYQGIRSGNTLCVKTIDGNIAVVGGTWSGTPSKQTALTWKLFK